MTSLANPPKTCMQITPSSETSMLRQSYLSLLVFLGLFSMTVKTERIYYLHKGMLGSLVLY